MDILSIVGVVLAFVAIIGGSILKGSGVKALLGAAAFVIVVLGTIAAILLQTPLATFMRAMKIIGWVFKPPTADAQAIIEKIVEWSNIARKQGLLGLESAVEQEPDEFVKKGLQSLVDGGEPDAIRATMEVELETRQHFDNAAAKVFEGMGIYSPTLGIIGAVMGLMAVMQNLADPSKLGHGIAAAFIATIYGIGLRESVFPADGQQAEIDRAGPVADPPDDHRRHHRDRAGREPAQHRSRSSRVICTTAMSWPASNTTRNIVNHEGLGHPVRRPRDAAARALRRHVFDVVGERRQVPHSLRFTGRGFSRHADDHDTDPVGKPASGKGGDQNTDRGASDGAHQTAWREGVPEGRGAPTPLSTDPATPPVPAPSSAWRRTSRRR